MSNTDFNVSMILRLVDRMTGPLRPVLGSIEKLDKTVGAAGGRMTKWAASQVEVSKARQASLRGETLEAGAMGAALVAFVQPAVQFEKAMAGVNKVMEFENAESVAKLGRDIQKLTTVGRLPMTAQEITEIAEAAGQAGLIDFTLGDDATRAQVIAFATDAARMGVAFDMGAAQAGEAMAQWRARLGLTREETLLMGDAANHLSNKMNASAADIVSVLGRQGAVATSTGLLKEEVAALSAAFVAAAPSPEIAATGMKNFVNALTKGDAVTAAQERVYAAIGLDPVMVAERMTDDAKATIDLVLDGIRNLPLAQQNAAVGQLFGEEAKGAITPLVQNNELLAGAFDLVKDRSELAGSMLAEYEVQAATTAAAQQVLLNSMHNLSVTLGTTVLPALNETLDAVLPLLNGFTEWAAANSGIISMALKTVGVLVGLKIAFTLLRWPYLALQFLLVRKIQILGFLTVAFGKTLAALKLVSVLGFGLLARAVRGVFAAVQLFSRFLLANPVVLVATAIAGIAWLIYDNWDQIWSWMIRKVDAVRAAFEEGLLNGVLKLLSEFNPLTLLAEALGGLLGKLSEMLGLPEEITDAFYAMDLVGAGVAMIRSLKEGAMSVVGDMVDAIQAKLDAIVPEWMQSAWSWVSGSDPETPQARAIGGSFRSGPLLVGERGPELGYASEGGYIAHHEALRRMVHMAERARALVAGIDLGSAVDMSRGLDMRPALAVRSSSRPTRIEMNIGGITITAAPGMDAEDVARAVTRHLRELQDEARHVLHDGGER